MKIFLLIYTLSLKYLKIISELKDFTYLSTDYISKRESWNLTLEYSRIYIRQ